MPLRIETFDPSGAARRRLEVARRGSPRKESARLPRELVFADLRDGSSATVKVLAVEFDADLPAGLLTKKALARGRH